MQFLLCALPLLLLAGCGGCRQAAPPPAAAGPGGPAAAGQHREELLTLAIDNLNRLEEFSSADVLQQIIERLDPRNQPKPGPTGQHFDPLLAAWPEPEMLGQIVDRLNQWVHAQQPPADWKPDPMAAALPKPLAGLPQLKDLGGMEFSPFDGYFLQEAAWLRDVSLGTRGDVLDDLERAKSVFDWTVRNIQLEAGPARTARRSSPGRRCCLAAARPPSGRGSSSSCCGNWTSTPRCWQIERRGRRERRGGKHFSAQSERSDHPPPPLVRRRADRGRGLSLRSRRWGCPFPRPTE